ncbi:MAG: tetratricopeptide repeat-containing sulfotransferase family protein, partial [Akkermansiaceae bacterium]
SFDVQESSACRRVRERWIRSRDDQALEMWRRLALREPQNLRSLGMAARAFGERYRYEKCLKLLDKIERLDPESPLVHRTRAEVFEAAGLLEKVTPAYQKALRLANGDESLIVSLAHQYERGQKLDEALDLLSRVDENSRYAPRAQLIQARVLNRMKERTSTKDLLGKLINQLPGEDDIRLEAMGDLTLIHDREGNYDEAFRLIGETKKIHLGRCASQKAASDHATRRFAELVDSMSADDVSRWNSESLADGNRREDLTPALLAGFPRSGTTLMEQVLNAHPSVVSSEEVDLLAREILPAMHGKLGADVPLLQVLNEIKASSIRKNRGRIWKVFETMAGESFSGKTHVDKNPAYNLLIPFYLRLFPELKLLIAVRDPRDVLLSCYLRYLPLNPVSVTFLTLESTAHRYALDMTAWLKFSDMIPNPWVEIRYEDMVENMEREARKICQTLGVDWHDDILRYREKLQDKRVHSPTYADVKKPIYKRSLNRWKNYEKHLEPQFDTLAPFVEAFGYDH